MPTLGTCPVCERAIRVRSGKMVHHGYLRPGRGHIVGDCFAVGREPYEISCAATRDYRAVVEGRLLLAKDFLVRLEAGTITALPYDERVPVPTTEPRPRFARNDPGWTWRTARVTRSETEAARQAFWQVVFVRVVSETSYEVDSLTREIERCERLIRDWRPGELREAPVETPKTPGRRRRRLFFSRRG